MLLSPTPRTLNSLRVALGAMAAALVLVAVLGTPQGRGAAAQFLAGFRSQRLAPVPLNAGQVQNIEQTLTQLEKLGTVRGIDNAPEPRAVASVAEASRIAGFPVKQPDPASLPAGVSKTPSTVNVLPAGEVRFTLDREKAQAYYRSIGRADMSLPERFHGASLVVRTPTGVVLEYRSANAGSGALGDFGLMIGQAGELTVEVEGVVSLEEMRDFLLGLPGLSPETVRELRAIEDWRTTLPLPIPLDQFNWQQATLAGGPGLILNDNTGLGSAAIWQQNGRIFGIAGAVRAQEIQRVADSLR